MRFLIDADLPRSTATLLTSSGHEGIDVRDIGMASADDATIAKVAQSQQLCLLTGDFGFSDVRNYPPHDYFGLVVLQLPADATANIILQILKSLLDQNAILEKIPGRLAIVSIGRVRLRPK